MFPIRLPASNSQPNDSDTMTAKAQTDTSRHTPMMQQYLTL
jgi:hypothetical protein